MKRGLGALKTLAGAAVLAASMGGTMEAKGAMIGFTAYGTYTGSPISRDGVTLITGATASQAYTLDTVTKTGSATETITSGENTYEFSGNTLFTYIFPDQPGNSFVASISGFPPYNFGFIIRQVNDGGNYLNSDLSNLSDFFGSYNKVGSPSSLTALLPTDRLPDFRLDSVVVPEPATLSLLAAGGLVLASNRRRKEVALA